MAAYSVQHEHLELSDLLTRAEAGEDVVLTRDGRPAGRLVAIIEHEKDPGREEQHPIRRSGGKNLLGLAGTDLSWLDEPLHEDVQRAFGMID